MRNLRLDICYDGTRYRGWQRLPGKDDTIQGKLETTLSRILGEEIEISGSGRTDAGVHARGQVANFHCESNMKAEEILLKLRMYLPEDIGIYSCKDVSQRFHARLNAKEKTYRYRIWNSDLPCVFERRYTAVVAEKLDIGLMQEAAGYFCGEHDFAAFCTNANVDWEKLLREIFEPGFMSVVFGLVKLVWVFLCLFAPVFAVSCALIGVPALIRFTILYCLYNEGDANE